VASALLATTAMARLSPALFAPLLLAAACGDDLAATPDAGAPDAAPPGQGSEADAELVVNEVAPDLPGQPDWFEIVNRSDHALDLCGYFATDLLDRLDHYYPLGGAAPPDPCTPRMLEPGAYLLVYADDGAGAGDGADHAPFNLGQADEMHVATWTGIALDTLLYLQIGQRGQTLARLPDRDGLFYPAAPTPAAPNQGFAP
jgi:hypothetical protein